MEPSTTPPNSVSLALPVNSQVLDYRIDAWLEQGSYEQRYSAWDESLARSVELCEYAPQMLCQRQSDGSLVAVQGQEARFAEGRQLFLEQAQRLARINRPGLAHTLRCVQLNGTVYAVRERIHGSHLLALLQGRPAGDALLQGLLNDVLPALEALHAQGLQHLALRAEALVRDQESGNFRIVQLGSFRHAFARVLGEANSAWYPPYSAPEQYSRDARRIGPWSDLYALGALLYQAMTQQLPSEAPERLLSDDLDLAALVGERYPQSLVQAVSACLALLPEQRPASVAQLRTLLQATAPAPAVAKPVPSAAVVLPPAAPAAAPIPLPTPQAPAAEPTMRATREAPAPELELAPPPDQRPARRAAAQESNTPAAVPVVKPRGGFGSSLAFTVSTLSILGACVGLVAAFWMFSDPNKTPRPPVANTSTPGTAARYSVQADGSIKSTQPVTPVAGTSSSTPTPTPVTPPSTSATSPLTGGGSTPTLTISNSAGNPTGIPSNPVVPSNTLPTLISTPSATPATSGTNEPELAPIQLQGAPMGEAAAGDPNQMAPALGSSADLQLLLDQGARALRELRLTTPENDSALYYFQQALAVDPNNQLARHGLDQISERYAWLLQREIERGNYSKAHYFLKLGKAVQANHPQLLQLEQQLRMAEQGAANQGFNQPPAPAEVLGGSRPQQ